MPEAPSRWKAWALAARPKTLAAGGVPVLVGLALASAEGQRHLWPALATLAGAILIQIATNLANDYFDFQKGADGADRIGPDRAVQQGWITPKQMAIATGLVLLLAAGVAGYLVWVAGLPILVIAITSIVLAIAYTGGPFPLAYHGLGDLFVLLFFGIVAVSGTYYVQTLALTPAVVVAGTAVGLIATAILVVNNLRDRDSDARANKRTVVVRFGPRAARVEYTSCMVLAFLSTLAIPVLELGGWGWMLTWLALPLAVQEIRAIWTTDGAALNPHLGSTARVELVFGLLLAVGVHL